MPQAGTTARGTTPASNTRRAGSSSRGYTVDSASVVTRFAPADSPASTSRETSPPYDAAFSTTHSNAAATSSTAAGKGCSGASR